MVKTLFAMSFFIILGRGVSITQVKLRELPKVKYTGTRGRPKQLQPGEADPHAEERRRIQLRHRDSLEAATLGVRDMATLDQVGKTEVSRGFP